MLNGQGGHAPAGQGSQREDHNAGASDVTTNKLIEELAGLLRESQQPQQSQQSPHLHQPAPLPPLPVGVAARPVDGLSPGPLPAVQPIASLRMDEDESTLPIPSTWLQQPPERPAGWLSEQMRAAVLGFAVGLGVVLPLVLVLTGKFGAMPWSEPPSAKPQAAVPAPPASTRPKPTAPEEPARRHAAETQTTPASKPEQAKDQSDSRSLAAVQAPAQSPSRVLDPIRSLMNEGQRLIAAGNIPAAREVLSRAAASGTPDVTLALAETFDPNMLAAWGVRSVKADTDTARKLYRKALDGGIEKARMRLDALN